MQMDYDLKKSKTLAQLFQVLPQFLEQHLEN